MALSATFGRSAAAFTSRRTIRKWLSFKVMERVLSRAEQAKDRVALDLRKVPRTVPAPVHYSRTENRVDNARRKDVRRHNVQVINHKKLGQCHRMSHFRDFFVMAQTNTDASHHRDRSEHGDRPEAPGPMLIRIRRRMVSAESKENRWSVPTGHRPSFWPSLSSSLRDLSGLCGSMIFLPTSSPLWLRS